MRVFDVLPVLFRDLGMIWGFLMFCPCCFGTSKWSEGFWWFARIISGPRMKWGFLMFCPCCFEVLMVCPYCFGTSDEMRVFDVLPVLFRDLEMIWGFLMVCPYCFEVLMVCPYCFGTSDEMRILVRYFLCRDWMAIALSSVGTSQKNGLSLWGVSIYKRLSKT